MKPFDFILKHRAANLFSFISIFILTIVLTVTLGAGRGYHKIYEGVGGSGILAVFEGDVACPYISLVPETFEEKILKIPHVKDVAGEVRQRYTYTKNENLTLTSMDPDDLLDFKSIELDPTVFEMFKNTANGALVGRKIFNMFGWEVGREISAAGLVFKVAGVFEQPLSVYESMVILHKDYLQQLTAKQGYATSILIKTDLTGRNEQEKVMKAVEDLFRDHPSRIVCRSEDDLWRSIKASQGNLGDIIQALGILLGILLTILIVNNTFLLYKRKAPDIDELLGKGGTRGAAAALVFRETVLVCAGAGILAVPFTYLATLTHPYVGTDMFHPPIYADPKVMLIAGAVAFCAAFLSALLTIPAVFSRFRHHGACLGRLPSAGN